MSLPRDADSSPGPRPPSQRRGHKTLARIVSAAEHLLAEEGVEGTTVKAVMALAGVGPGSFYARFEGRDALLGYLQDRFYRELAAGWEALVANPLWTQAEPAVIAGEIVRLLVRGHAHHEARLRVSVAHALLHPADEAMIRMLESDALVLDRLTALFVPHTEDEAMVLVALQQLIGGLRAMVLFPDAEPFPPNFTEEDLIVQLTYNTLASMKLPG